MVEAAIMCGSKETEKQQASPNCEKREKAGQKCFVVRAQEFMGWPGRAEVARKAGSATSQEGPAQGLNRKELSQRPKGGEEKKLLGLKGRRWVCWTNTSKSGGTCRSGAICVGTSGWSDRAASKS